MHGLKNENALRAAVRAVSALLEKKLDPAAAAAEGRLLNRGLGVLNVLYEAMQTRSEHLAGERQRYAEFFEFAPDAYLVTNAYGHIRLANDAAVRLLGSPAGRLAGKPLALCFSLDERAAFREHLSELLHVPGVALHWRGRLLRREGSPLEIAIRARALPGAAGAPGELCWLLRPAG
jgi:PAS domain S-box-containing protein